MKQLIFLLLAAILILQACNNTPSDSANPKVFQWFQNNIQNPALDSLSNKVADHTYGNINEIFISKGDTILFSRKFDLDYFKLSKGKKGAMGCGHLACKDSSDIHPYNYYHPLYHPYYQNGVLHTLQSMTKSVCSTIIGCALFDKKIKSLSLPILPFFEGYKLNPELRDHLSRTTIEDVLTMRLGLAWKEMGMDLSNETDVSKMELSNDWVEYVLAQKIEAEPGKHWNYSSGATQLLSHILYASLEGELMCYLEKAFFHQLNISEYEWKKTPTGLLDMEGGLYMKAGDLAKIGLLLIQGGVFNDKRLLSHHWVQEATSRKVKDIYGDGGKEGYGYQWWISADEPPKSLALGFGNQIMVLVPEKKLVAIVFAWNVFDVEGKYILGDLMETLKAL